MSIGIQPGYRVSMQGVGGPLNLRSNHDKSRHTELIHNQNSVRHNAFLKEMLVNKFLSKNKLYNLGDVNKENLRQETVIQKFVTSQFENFIQRRNFTEAGLGIFEKDLKQRLQNVMSKQGYAIIETSQSQETQRAPLATRNVLYRNKSKPLGVQNPLSVNQQEQMSRLFSPQNALQANHIQERINAGRGGIFSQNTARGHGAHNLISARNHQQISKDTSLPVLNKQGLQIRQAARSPSHQQVVPPAHLVNKQINNLFENNDEGKNDNKHYSTIDVQENKQNAAQSGPANADIPASKNFADLRLKLGRKQLPDKYGKAPQAGSGSKGGGQVPDDESIPSDIDENQWAEIHQYDYEKYQQEQKQIKIEALKKRQIVKETLEKQMQERRQVKQQERLYHRKMDDILIKNAKKELEKEKKLEIEHQKKVQLQKVQRDVMLLEAQGKKIRDYQEMRNKELVEVEELKEGLKKEKKDAVDKKKIEKENCLKVIKENDVEKLRRLKDQEKERQKQIKIQEEYNAMLDRQDKQRADEWAAREERIQKIMGRMGDVLKKTDHAEREQDKRILQQQLKKDKEAEMAEKRKRDKSRQRNINMLKELDQQMQEKQQLREVEMINNAQYIKMVVSQDDRDKKMQEDKLKVAAQKRKDLQNDQIIQIQEKRGHVRNLKSEASDLGSSNGFGPLSMRSTSKRKIQGSHMNLEELRLNKGLLKEISKYKKQTGNAEKQSNQEAMDMNDIMKGDIMSN